MRITRNIREFAKEQNVAEEKALAVGMAEKAKEFVKSGKARFITGMCLMGRKINCNGTSQYLIA